MPISIYPPTLQSTQSAFLSTVSQYDIYFSLQRITSLKEIGHVQVRIVRQSNNRTIVDTTVYPDGTIYKPPTAISQVGTQYRVSIYRNELAESWQPGYLYKVQMRFGTTAMYNSIEEFADWKQKQIDNQTFSEWSTVMVIKSISEPITTIKNAQAVRRDVISTERTEPTLTPLFTGTCEIAQVNKEVVDKYKFDLYSGKDVDQLHLIESSGWLQHDSNVNTVDSFRFKNILHNNEYYTVTYQIVTVNGYEDAAMPYTFLASRSYYEELKGATLRIEDDTIYCKENGCLRVYLTAEAPLSGSFVLTRSEEKSNYEVWEDLRFFIFNKSEMNDMLILDDFTIESGIKYKYAIQQENAAGLRTSPIYDTTNTYHYIDLEYAYLYRNGVQLKLMYNNKMSTFKHTVLASKQDTLGSQYPHILKNGYAYYAEFPVTGLISFQMDEDQTFFSLKGDGFYYNNELIIPRDKLREYDEMRGPCAPGMSTSDTGLITNYNHLTIDSNLIEDNVFVERKFREKVEEFLNDYNCKLFRSATEGNFVVVLTNVSMTPNQTLGRMVYEFTATAYEVMENTLDNLNEYGVIDIGHFDTLASDEIHLSFGQISGLYTTNQDIDIYSLIKQQEEISLGGGYRARVERVRSFWIERYPKIDFAPRLNTLYADRAEAVRHGNDVEEIDAEINEIKALQRALLSPDYSNTILSVNGTRVLVRPKKIYSLREPVTTLQLTSSPCPIIINYVCEVTQQEDLSVGVVSAIDTSRIWGQISGVFTGTDKVIKTYNYNYTPNEPPWRVYNNRPDATVEYGPNGDVLVDNTNFNVYKTTNLLDVIKEETRKQVEIIYEVEGGFKQDSWGRWTDGTIYYELSDIIQFDIEADAGTSLLISPHEDGRDAKKIIIGPTERYSLNPSDSLIRYITLEPTQFEELVPQQTTYISKYNVPCRLHGNILRVDLSDVIKAGITLLQIIFKYGADTVASYTCGADAIYEHEYTQGLTAVSQLGIELITDKGTCSYSRDVYKRLAPRFCIVNYKCLTNQMTMLDREEEAKNARLLK